MNKYFKNKEMIIGLFLIICGVIIIGINAWVINITLSNFKEIPVFDNISIPKYVFSYYHQFLKGLLSILSGILLLRKKRIGWVLSITTCVIIAVDTLILLLNENHNEIDNSNDSIFYGSMIILLFMGLAAFLINNQFRKKYLPKKQSWITIGIIITIFIIDSTMK